MSEKNKSEEIYKELSAPFEEIGADGKTYPSIKWKLQTRQGVCVPYIDARQVSARLNKVLGVDGWESTLIETSGKYIIFELTCKINGEEITKTDVGTPGDYAAEKAQVSDALKRAAIHFGIGAYIYNIKPVILNTDGKYAITAKGEKLTTGEALSSYINQKNPLRAKLGEIFSALNEENQAKLSEEFTKIWEALNE